MNSKRKAKSLRFSSHSSKVFRQFAYSYDVKVSKSINLGTLTSEAPSQIDIIWLGELVKRLGNSPHLRRRGPLNRLYLGAMTSEAVS